jgi:hypothetical protein
VKKHLKINKIKISSRIILLLAILVEVYHIILHNPDFEMIGKALAKIL